MASLSMTCLSRSSPLRQRRKSRVRLSVFNGRLAQVSRARRLGVALRAALAEHADVYHIHEQELIPVGRPSRYCVLLPRWFLMLGKTSRFDACEILGAQLWRSQLGSASAGGEPRGKPGLGRALSRPPRLSPRTFQSWGARQTCVYYNFPTLSLFSPGRGRPPAAPVDLVYGGDE